MDGAAAVSDVLYRYDGSYPGFLCCIFESYAQKELPLAVCGPEEGQTSLYAMREIETDLPRARRVEKGVDRLGGAVRARLMTGFLSGDDGKDLTLLRFARAAFRQGPGAAQMLGDPDVSAAFALERAVNNEACWMREFLRFEQRGPMLGAVIHPRHYVLPLLRAHFCSRLPDENFVILDAVHGAALLRQGADVQYLQMRQFTAAPEAGEAEWRALWQRFFRALTIEERYNPACQAGHCRKRFWRDMPEMQGAPPDLRGQAR